MGKRSRPGRLARLAGYARLPARTVRLRLTVFYTALILVSGVGLLAIADTLDWHATRGALPQALRGKAIYITQVRRPPRRAAGPSSRAPPPRPRPR